MSFLSKASANLCARAWISFTLILVSSWLIRHAPRASVTEAGSASASRTASGALLRVGLGLVVDSVVGSIGHCRCEGGLGEVASFGPQSGLVEELIDAALLLDRQRFDDRFAGQLFGLD